MERRDFLRLSAFASLTGFSDPRLDRPAAILESALREAPGRDAEALATDDSLWLKVRDSYVTEANLIDLDNANTAPTPAETFAAYIRHARKLRHAPSSNFGAMWEELDKISRVRLAAFLGARPEHLAIMPNATSGLNTVLHGFPMSRGDEILVTNHEYPDMIETVLQRAKRDGIVIRTVAVPSPNESGLDLVERVDQAITPRTKLLLVSHVSAWSGEVLPVETVTAAARKRGVAVVLDAAQSVGMLDVKFSDLGVDFLATSLHKWLAAPMGTGALIMRPEHIGKVWPLHPPSWDTAKHPMDVYEWMGTFNMAAYASIIDALDFQDTLGFGRKQARIRYLGDYWRDRLSMVPGLQLLTPPDIERSFGVAAFALEHVPSEKVVMHLRAKNGIVVQNKAARHSPFKNAIRVSPGVYATTRELDRFVAAVKGIARSGLVS